MESRLRATVVGLTAAAIGLAGGAGMTVPSAEAKDAPALITAYKVFPTQCVPSGNNVKARVTGWMRVVNHEGFGGDWAQGMRVKARLERTVGHHLDENWYEQKSGYLGTNKTHRLNFAVVTDNKMPGTWILHVRLTWDRPTNTDIVKYFKVKKTLVCESGVGENMGVG
jgi:hypothetical protein